MSPSRVLALFAVGHATWGAVAYRHALQDIVSDLPGSVGDGLFDREHADDKRAAAFWFMFATPMLLIVSRLARAAEEANDRAAQRDAGALITGVALAGLAVVPRSGFVGPLPLGLWMLGRNRKVDRGPSAC